MCGKARERKTRSVAVERAQHRRAPVQPRRLGAPHMGQCGVASLGKGWPFPAGRALPWPMCGALIPNVLTGQHTSSFLVLN